MLTPKIKIREVDSGWDKFAQELENLGTKKVQTGIQASEDAKLLIYAGANEFGATIPVTNKMRGFFRHVFKVNLKKSTTEIKLPPRPFIRQTFDKRIQELDESGVDLGKLVIDNTLTLKQALEIWGDKFISFVRSEVAEGVNFAPNTPLTIKRKGSGKHPLQGDGRLMLALKSVVK